MSCFYMPLLYILGASDKERLQHSKKLKCPSLSDFPQWWHFLTRNFIDPEKLVAYKRVGNRMIIII